MKTEIEIRSRKKEIQIKIERLKDDIRLGGKLSRVVGIPSIWDMIYSMEDTINILKWVLGEVN